MLQNFFEILGLLLVIGFVHLGVSACSTMPLYEKDRKEIAGRTFVVTGASSGFGRGVAVKLGSLHANVVLAARRTDLLNEVATEVRAAGGTPLVVTTDVAKAEDVRKLADAAVRRFGRFDVWINNAGIGAIGRFEEIPVADYSRLIDINLKGVVYGSHVAMHQFRRQGYGVLVNVGSVDSVVPPAYQTVYAATKAGVLSLGQSLNQEIRLSGKRNIKVSTIMPWATDTPWWMNAANYSGGKPRMAAMDDPQEVIDTIVWASVHPLDKIPVGWKAKAAYHSHRFFPDMTEHMSANIVHKYQYETAPPAPRTDGALFTPSPVRQGMDGGLRARMAHEDQARKSADKR